ncbi:uncharacterized protein TNCV_1284831 [Trichonephila clavipes]|uniref:Transposase n=1 Tax=Trichonephila clavipes TaxID=2585209 RepID=A0A8X6SQL2_TRICX|nr:uncharacterized protein TNCV_1284831 [Trichonephila clavipes]
MITNVFIPELNNHDVQELWFQQDCATCHTARATIDLLKDTFGDRLISRFGPVNWLPRSCDLTPLDYFLWGYVKPLFYEDNPQTLDHLEDNICRVIADIRPQMLEKVIENMTTRLDYIRVSRGSPMPEIIFKIGVNSELIGGWSGDLLRFLLKVLRQRWPCAVQKDARGNLQPNCRLPRYIGSTPRVMVWGAISYIYDSRSTLVVIPNTLTANLCVTLVIRPVVLPNIISIQGGLFQQENAHAHVTVVTQRSIQSVDMLP